MPCKKRHPCFLQKFGMSNNRRPLTPGPHHFSHEILRAGACFENGPRPKELIHLRLLSPSNLTRRPKKAGAIGESAVCLKLGYRFTPKPFFKRESDDPDG